MSWSISTRWLQWFGVWFQNVAVNLYPINVGSCLCLENWSFQGFWNPWNCEAAHDSVAVCHELAIPLLFFYLFLFFSFSFGTYPTSCSNGTLDPAYSRPWHILPTAYSSIPILFRFTPQRAFCYWLASYLVTFHSTYVIDVPFHYILHMYLLRFPSQVLVNTPSSLTHYLSPSP